jgi:signal transduction histidine kinase/ligand-binding sensor domain-containing protein/DNA-binding response OmpR family regulator
MKYFAFLIFLLGSELALQAQSGQYQFAHLDINNGLSHNNVTCFFKDRKGFLWIGTPSGLNRFDGYTVKKYFSDLQDSASLKGNGILAIYELPGEKMMVITSDGGISVYDPQLDHFLNELPQPMKDAGILTDLDQVVHDAQGNYGFIPRRGGIYWYTNSGAGWIKPDSSNENSIKPSPIRNFIQSKDGSYWLIHADGWLEQIEIKGTSHKVIYRTDRLRTGDEDSNFKILEDLDGDLWICRMSANGGIYLVDRKTKTFTAINKDSKGWQLSSNLVSGGIVDSYNQVWVGTDHGGVNIIYKKKKSVQTVMHHDEDFHSLGQNSITAIYRDDQDIIWIGTFKRGVSYYHEKLIRFPLFQHSLFEPNSLPFNDVNRFVEDKKGNLWIGTNGGGLIYFDRTTNRFQQYRHDPQNANSLSSDVIVSLAIDAQGILWIGTYFGGLNSFDGKRFTRYVPDARSSSQSGRSIWEIFEDSQKQLWIGTLDAGLYTLDRKTGVFTRHEVSSPYISSILEDREGNLWIGTVLGIDVWMKKTGRFVHYGNEKGNKNSLSNNSILDMREDKQGRIWIATQGGLNLFQKHNQTFKVIREADGLPSNAILTLLVDNHGNLWMSTANGISNIIFTKTATDSLAYVLKNYDEADGLQGKQFNENAALKTSQGELIFGGANGFNIFKPEELKLNQVPPNVVLTDFQLFNKSIRAGEAMDNTVILTKSISESNKVILASDQNVFSIEFAALNFLHAEKNKYKYQLEGFNKDWLTTDARARRITFTNLDPGDYTFRVKAANNDGVWNEQGASLKIKVLPPFWKTKTAFAFYFVFILTALFITRRLIQQRERMKFVIRQERQEAVRMHQLDMMKIKFFTNVSHEFRTPLSLIIAPLEKLLRQTNDEEQQKQFQLIQRNAKRLLNLVNQLLDFRKMEVQELKFNPSEGDIIAFLSETVSSFNDLSEKKHIRLEFKSSVSSLETFFDKDKLEKIVLNLLSNAFKFTHENGEVFVDVEITSEADQHYLILRVKDSGIGIPKEKQDRIFERFFQNDLPESMVNQGSGIGLSITKEFVRIHGGTIRVESEPGAGSCFIVVLPIREILNVVTQPAAPEPVREPSIHEAVIYQDHSKPLLLLVEDNEDFRFYLKDNLSQTYHVMEAKDGLEGWIKILEHLPDLIVSDVMMPHLNGIELTRKVKTDQRVSHIPIILLTARTAEEQKLEGFEAGSDEYLTKPFNFEILLSRIRHLIEQREKFQKAFPKQVGVKASELNITSLDEKFIKDAIKCVEDNIESPDFSVEDLSRHLAISRAHLYKKIHALTGKSPLEFMRTIRLQQAAQFLEKSQLTVAEVAYKVGFNNPKYFAKYFKEQYGVLPSVYSGSRKLKN